MENSIMPIHISRRQFFEVTAAGAVGVTNFKPHTNCIDPVACRLSPFASAGANALTTQSIAAGWYDQPMRWVQLTLVENDPGRFDPDFWLDYFRRLHADAATLSAGGIVAYYPTEIPLHHRSAWLGQTDPFGTLLAGCRRMNMRVVARTDPHAVRDDVRAAHPDWISVAADGQPRRHWANP